MKNVNIFLANVLAFCVQVLVYGAAYVAGVLGFFQIHQQLGTVTAVLLIPVVIFAVAILIIVETFVIRILIPRPRPGVSKVGQGAHFLYQLNKRVFCVAINPAFPPLAMLFKMSDFFRILILKSQGATIRFSSTVARTARIHDPYLLTVGRGAHIGEEVQIYSSAFEAGKILLYRVFIGPNALLGASSLLFPGTEIGEGSVLGMGSSTRNEMKIPSYELWVGNPAGHLAKLPRPMLYTAAPTTERERPQEQDRYRGRNVDADRGRDRGHGNDRGDRGDRGGERGERSDRGDRGRDRGRFNRDRDRQGRSGSRSFNRHDARPESRPVPAPSEQPQQQAPIEPMPVAPVVETPRPVVMPTSTSTPTPAVSPVRTEPIVTERDNTPYIGPIDLSGKPTAPKITPHPSENQGA